jgi:tetratricopeptide (TPR) repeat protein
MTSGSPEEQKKLTVFQDTDHMTVMTENNLTWPSTDPLEGLEAGRKKLPSGLEGLDADYQAKLAMKAGRAMLILFRESNDLDLLDEAIRLYREALALQRTGNPDRAGSCVILGTSLCARFQQAGDITLLDEAIELGREALALRPPGHPDRASTCGYLATSLHKRYGQTSDVALLDEAIELEREALALRPPGHPSRSISCATLGSSLHMRYKQIGDVALLDEAIELKREVLSLRPPGHPSRSISCANLGTSLHVRYKETGDVALLDEAIELKREALALQPPGQPNRAASCVSLGSSLYLRCQQTSDVALLHEAIELGREALALQPPGHPSRSISCTVLASVLNMRGNQTGDIALLDEAIKLMREALALQPPGHPDRATSCVSLESALSLRYQQTGDVALLDEAIALDREAIVLRPSGHPSRSISCANLGTSLHVRYKETGDVALLDEAIELKREALALQPSGHSDRATSCLRLAASLHVRYMETGDVALLDEAIELGREALALQPLGHPDRPTSCVTLVSSLSLRYQKTSDVALLHEALDTCTYASKHSSASRVWYPLTWLSRLHLFSGSPHYSALEALGYLHRSFQHEVDSIPTFISQVCSNAMLIWDNSSTWTSHITALLVDVYTQLVDRLPLMAGFVLDTSNRLRILKATRRVGSDACVAALLAGQPALAVTILDRAHGVVWTQALHQRDPQMQGAPKQLAIELEDLLRAIATSVPVDPAGLPDHPQDLRHGQNTRIQVILREIRAIPGLARFMLGSTYETLREAARDHPVVVLVAARDHAFALIMPNSSYSGPDILRLDVANYTLQSFANSVGQANLRYRACSPSGQDVHLADSAGLGPNRKMGPGNFVTHRSPLAKLWLDVVKPVLTHLGLSVRPSRKRKATHH